MSKGVLYCFVKSYMAIFDAYIDSFNINGNLFYGKIGWEGEEDIQEISCSIKYNESLLFNLILLCDLLNIGNLTKGDKILVSENELILKLETKFDWKTQEAKQYLDYLLDVEMKMIDDGEETDSFFLHF